MFYANNTFSITKMFMHRFQSHDTEGMHLTMGAKWLTGLGSQVSMLRRVTLDLDLLCPSSCETGIDFLYVDGDELHFLRFGPLVQAMWSYDHDLDISFVHSQGMLDRLWRHSHGSFPSMPCPHPIDVMALSKMLWSLHKDSLGIRKHCRFISDIAVARSGGEGFVVYRTNALHVDPRPYGVLQPGARENTIRRFAADRGENLRMEPRTPPTLLGLPKDLQHQIFGRVMFPVGGVMVHLDKDVIVELEKNRFADILGLSVAQVNQELAFRYASAFWRNNTFILGMTTSGPRTSFNGFSALRRWMCSGASTTLPYLGGKAEKTKEMGGLQIALRFKLSELPKLPNLGTLRINVIDLVLILAHIERRTKLGDVEIRIVLWKCDEDGRKTFVADTPTMLHWLRSTIFQALSWIISRDSSIADAGCPDISLMVSARQSNIVSPGPRISSKYRF